MRNEAKIVKCDRNILVIWSHPPIFPPLGAQALALKKNSRGPGKDGEGPESGELSEEV